MQKLLEKQKRLELITNLKQQKTQQKQETQTNNNRSVPSQTAVKKPVMNESRDARESKNYLNFKIHENL